MYQGNIGYIKLSEFSDNAGRDLRTALKAMMEKKPDSIAGRAGYARQLRSAVLATPTARTTMKWREGGGKKVGGR